MSKKRLLLIEGKISEVFAQLNNPAKLSFNILKYHICRIITGSNDIYPDDLVNAIYYSGLYRSSVVLGDVIVYKEQESKI